MAETSAVADVLRTWYDASTRTELAILCSRINTSIESALECLYRLLNETIVATIELLHSTATHGGNCGEMNNTLTVA